MCVYMEISGAIHFKDKETAQKAIDFVIEGGWIREDKDSPNKGLWISENGGFGEVELDKDYLTFNGGIMFNIGKLLSYILDNYDIDKENTHYRTLCTHGMFALSEYDADAGIDISVDSKTFIDIVGCSEDDIIYEEDETHGKDKDWIDNNKYRFYSTVYKKACDWLLEG